MIQSLFKSSLDNAVSVIISTLLINFLFSEHREKVEQSASGWIEKKK